MPQVVCHDASPHPSSPGGSGVTIPSQDALPIHSQFTRVSRPGQPCFLSSGKPEPCISCVRKKKLPKSYKPSLGSLSPDPRLELLFFFVDSPTDSPFRPFLLSRVALTLHAGLGSRELDTKISSCIFFPSFRIFYVRYITQYTVIQSFWTLAWSPPTLHSRLKETSSTYYHVATGHDQSQSSSVSIGG